MQGGRELCRIADLQPLQDFFNGKVGPEHAIDELDAYYKDLLVFLESYCFIRYSDDPHGKFRAFAEYNSRLQYLEFAARTSFLMDALVGYIRNEFATQEILGIYKALEIFVVRRLICNMGLGGMNNMMPTWFKQILQLREKHAGRGRTRIFPNDAEVCNAVENYPMGTYANRHLNYILSCIEDSIQPSESRLLSQIRTGEIKLSIEHIIPQTLTPAWKRVLGDSAETVYETWLNRLFNLTLTGYNSTYSNKPFTEKKTCENGFANSPLNINRHIAGYEDWNEAALKRREAWLTERILQAWPALISSISPDDESRPGRHAIGDGTSLTHSKPVYVEICGTRFTVSSWRQLAETVCKQLTQLDGAIFKTFLTDEDFALRGGGRLVSSAKNSLRSAAEVAPGIFLEVHLNANELRELVLKIAKKYELEDAIFFKVER